MVEFCDECGALLISKKGKEVKCPSCGKIHKTEKEIIMKEEIRKKEDLKIIDKTDKSINIHPLIEQKCPKCGHNKCYYWTKQMRASDEPETNFYKCEKCRYQWREYE